MILYCCCVKIYKEKRTAYKSEKENNTDRSKIHGLSQKVVEDKIELRIMEKRLWSSFGRR
jgi:hypothetical protein